MKIKDFYELVELNREPEASLLPNLQYRIKKYPYFQADIFIYLKCLYLSSSEDFTDELTRLSPFISDRKALFYYVMDDQYGLFLKKMEQRLGSDRTNILINAFFDKLDQSQVESVLDNIIGKPSLASSDYFAYLQSFDKAPSKDEIEPDILRSILPENEIFYTDVAFKEMDTTEVDNKLKTENESKIKPEIKDELEKESESEVEFGVEDELEIEDDLEVENHLEIKNEFEVKFEANETLKAENKPELKNEIDDQLDTENISETEFEADQKQKTGNGNDIELGVESTPYLDTRFTIKEEDRVPLLKHQDIIDQFIAKAEEEDIFRIQLQIPSKESAVWEDDFDESESFSSTEDIENDFFFTQTLANIYIKQKKYERAYEIIKHLSLNYPEKSIYFADQLSFLDKLMKYKNINK